MAKYKITFKKSVTKDFKFIPNSDVNKILSCIDSLAENPRANGCVKLSGKEQYRIRQGLYRIVYEIQDANLIVVVIKVGHRSSVYKSN